MKTIVVVEDDPIIGEMLTDVLQLAGYRSMLAGDGEEGLARIRETLPDMVLCDVQLPQMDGAGVAQAMRTEPALQATPLVLMSAAAEHLVGAAGSYGHAALLKPIGVQALLETVAAYIGDPLDQE